MGLGGPLVSLECARSTRLSLLVPTVAHSVRLVGRQNFGMGQTLLSRILSCGRDYRAIFYLDAATPTNGCRGINDLPSNGHRPHRKLLLLQSADHRVVLAIDR